ncbi:MAG: putative maltokinase [Deltaproteobacteria bacterium]|nr:putative maltokinase [Deltaproteobacteria bacterium]
MIRHPTAPTMPSSAALPRWDAHFAVALAQALPAWIAARRWYRTKTKRVSAVEIEAAFPIPYEGGVARLAVVSATLDDGGRDLYVVPLAWVAGEEAAAVREQRPHAVVLAGLHFAGEDGMVVDALALTSFAAALLSAIARGETAGDGGWALSLHGSPEVVRAVARGPRPSLVEREQTNTSIVFGDEVVMKVVRKLDPGESPDLEVGRFLTEVGYAHTPRLLGWAEVKGREAGEDASTLAVLHAFVESRGDAWRHALDVLDAWLVGVAQQSIPPPDLAGLLGRRVGELHVALASRTDHPAFAPAPLGQVELGALVARTRTELSRALEMVGARAGDLPDGERLALADIRGALRAVDARLDRVRGLAEAGLTMRVHGDLHLGQVLFTGKDYVILDFEGEPARPLAERRRKRSPLVDVAGMLRSFHYASVATVRARPESERADLARWAERWHAAMTAQFLEAWREATRGAAFAPSDPSVTNDLLFLFLLEKVAYELHYEMNHRPDWVAIPLAGLRQLALSASEDRDRPLAPVASAPSPTTEPQARASLAQPMSLYEIDLAEWQRPSEGGARPRALVEVAEPLTHYARGMGFTHVALSVAAYAASPDEIDLLAAALRREGLGLCLSGSLEELAEKGRARTLRRALPGVVLAAKDAPSGALVTQEPSEGGLGLDLRWDTRFSHDLRRYLGTDPIHRSALQELLTSRSVYAEEEAYVLPLSRAEGAEAGSSLAQMHGDPWQRLANLRLLHAYQHAQPGKKLTAMDVPIGGVVQMVRDLNHLHREVAALHERDRAGGFEWIDGTNAPMSVVTFLRKGAAAADVVLVACNFTPVPRYGYRIGVPRGGRWREIFNSDARTYGGSGHGNLGGVDAVPYPWNGRESSIVLTLPPLGILFFAR